MNITITQPRQPSVTIVGGGLSVVVNAPRPVVTEVNIGRQGAPGIGLVHLQTSASSVWTINHNLGLRPSVSVQDSAGYEIDADVGHPSTNQTVINFVTSMAGTARLN